MKQILILGAGTSGTMMSNHLRKALPKDKWSITIVDNQKTHYYQPGFLFLPFDLYQTDQLK
jgi:sulfide:quinone oxidoreductase